MEKDIPVAKTTDESGQGKKESVNSKASSKREMGRAINAEIRVTDKNSQKVVGKYIPNKINGKYLVVLPPGVYELTVNADGYEKYSEDVKVFDRPLDSEITKDIILSNIGEEEKKN